VGFVLFVAAAFIAVWLWRRIQVPPDFVPRYFHGRNRKDGTGDTSNVYYLEKRRRPRGDWRTFDDEIDGDP
jgi:hypothetical protein